MGYHKLRLVGWYGHAGTLISAVLYYSVSDGEWRLTVLQKRQFFSVIQAGLFPIIHMGRPWLRWVLPIPINLDLYG
jgi:molybdopterin-containing oxidoreductase family membrane subunit